MITELSNTDYNAILKYYSVPINYKDMNKNKLVAEHLLATKLCRCIKKVKAKQNNKKDEKRPIAICKTSIFNKRNLKISKFTCKKKPGLIAKKGEKTKLFKKGKLKLTIKNKTI